MLVEGLKTQLVPFSEKHLRDPDYYKWLTDFEVVRYLGREEYWNQIPFDDVVKYVEDVWNNPFRFFFAVYNAEKSDFIGTATINFGDRIGFQNKVADIGIMIGAKRFWGHGFASDVISALSKYCFSEMNSRKLTAGIMSVNIGMLRAFQKNGFLEEGRLRDQLPLPDGGICDHVLLGCFEDELDATGL